MNPNCSIRFLIRVALATLGFAGTAGALFAQASTTGSIEGRVYDAGRGEYLENARVTVEGTNLEAFTDSGGFYRLSDVPAGTARLRVFFTGLASSTDPVPVTAGQTATRDVTFGTAAQK